MGPVDVSKRRNHQEVLGKENSNISGFNLARVDRQLIAVEFRLALVLVILNVDISFVHSEPLGFAEFFQVDAVV